MTAPDGNLPVLVAPHLDAGSVRLREIAYAPGLRQPRHTHDEASLTLVLGGDVRETVGAREEVGSALSVVFKPAGVEHANDVGRRGARTLQIVFPAGVPAELGLRPRDASWRWLHAGPPARPLLRLLALARGNDRNALAMGDVVLDALAALLPDPRAHSGGPPRWLERVREELHDEPLHARTARELAADAGAHPVTLSRAFRRHYGCTLTEYRRRARLRRAAGAIEGSRATLSRVAHDAGFADHPHLCREFRAATGLSPSRFRTLTGTG
jgi:AraC family transcriptional regulator